jgi:hypothetical protein
MTMRALFRYLRASSQRAAVWAGLALSFAQAPLLAAPGDTLFFDNLNGNLNDWTVVASGGDASIGSGTSSSGTSLRLRWDAVYLYSNPIVASVGGAELTVWIRRGSDSFSNRPESGEDLLVEYRNPSNAWLELDTFDGDGAAGEIFMPTYVLPADALHSNLSIRFRLTSGSGIDQDYWHVDDVRVTELAGGGSLGLGTCEDFENGLGGWVVDATSGSASASAGIGSQTFNSVGNSLYTEGGIVSVTSSDLIDLGGALFVALDVWVQKGDNSFSGQPEDGENLVIEYLNDGGAWTVLETFAGGNPQGEVFDRSYDLPAAALHAGFRIRFRQTGGTGNTDYWHVDDVCLVGGLATLYTFEEDVWTGASGEVQDGSGNGLNGTAFGGAVNAATMPALATNPGTCRYGTFDGVDQYVEVADNAALDIQTNLTVAAWIYMRSYPSELHTIVSKDTNYEFHVDDSGQIFWLWEAANLRTTGFGIALNRWYHVAITYESGSQRIYVDGVQRAAASNTGTLPQNDLPFFIGTDYDFITRAFDGYIDEVYVLPSTLSQAQIQTLMSATHDCATAAAQFTINHDNFGIHCLAEAVAVDVIDANAGTPLINYAATVQLDTQSGRGTWQLVSGGGSFSDGAADDGIAAYDWPLGESQAVFALTYLQGPPVVDIDVFQLSDVGIRDTDAEGNLVFSASGFTLTAAALSNPPPGLIGPFDAAQTAGMPFALHIAAYGQTANDPVCGVIESYTGNKSLEFWSNYLDPATGSIAVQIEGVPIAGSEPAAAGQTVAFVNGQAVVAANYKDVGSKQILVKDDTTVNAELPGGIRGATAGFVVAPYDFVLSDIRNAAGTVVNPGADDASGPVFIAAGTPFRATVEAVDADGDPAPNYGRESIPETVRLSSVLVEPLGGNAPAVTAAAGFAGFSGGAATGFDFVWREVGVIDLAPEVGDGDYLGAGNVAGSTAARVGRFVPNHFDVAPNDPMLQTACGPGTFSYIGQSFGYLVAPVLMVTAKDAGGATTVNYSGAFFKLGTTTLANRSYTSTAGALDVSGVPAPAADPSVVPLGAGVATVTFSGGSGLRFARGAVEAPFDAEIRLSIDVLDADGVAALGNPQVFGAGAGMLFNAGTEFRYGRVRVGNAFGSERVNLPVPVTAEYYAGPAIGFVPNIDDTCTMGLALMLGGYTETLSATCALDGGTPGASGIGCAAPAPSAQQFRQPPVAGNFNLTLAAPGPGNTGGVTISATVPDYLRFDWNAALPGNEEPSGHATFGLYEGQSRQIYLREIY